MSVNNAMMKLLPALFSFSGRMRRRDFWFYTVLGNLCALVLLFVDITLPQVIFPTADADAPMPTPQAAQGMAIMLAVTVVLYLWVVAALFGKRLHDRSKSIIWLLAGLIPIVGWVWLYIDSGMLEGDADTNRYGLSSKSLGSAETAKVSD